MTVDDHPVDPRFPSTNFDGVEGPRTEDREALGRTPSDVDQDRVAQGQSLPNEPVSCGLDVDEVPVQTGLESGRQTGRDVGHQD